MRVGSERVPISVIVAYSDCFCQASMRKNLSVVKANSKCDRQHAENDARGYRVRNFFGIFACGVDFFDGIEYTVFDG